MIFIFIKFIFCHNSYLVFYIFSTPIPTEELDVDMSSPQRVSEPPKDSAESLSKEIEATNDKNELPLPITEKNAPSETSNVSKDDTNVKQTEQVKDTNDDKVSENSPNVDKVIIFQMT